MYIFIAKNRIIAYQNKANTVGYYQQKDHPIPR